jgi:hypothetical protein
MKIHELEEGLGSWIAGKLGKAAKNTDISPGQSTTPLRQVTPTWPWSQALTRAQQQGIKFVPLTNQGDRVVDIAGRPIVVIDMGGSRSMPFYVSTGGGGKAGVPVGQWYPFFGIHSSGWFNKGWSEAQINAYYGSAALKRVAQTLDSTLGDLRRYTEQMPGGVASVDIINRGQRPVSLHSVESDDRAYKQYQDWITAQARSF